MKKSQAISLVLITAALASCHTKTIQPKQPQVYMRSDTTAAYTHTRYHDGNTWLWYYAFRPYGYYNGGVYTRYGYYSRGISESANIGHSSAKSGVVRGGFGEGSHGMSVSS